MDRRILDSPLQTGSSFDESDYPDSEDAFPWREVTEADGGPPVLPLIGCRCKRGCNTTQCICRKAGRACEGGCACTNLHGPRGDPCQSPLRHLAISFGSEPVDVWTAVMCRHYHATAYSSNACFTHYVNHTNLQFDLHEQLALIDKFKIDCDAWTNDPQLVKWKEDDEKLDKNTKEYVEHVDWLYRYAVGVNSMTWLKRPENREPDPDNSYVWSFCRDGWVLRQRVKHCWHCKKCYEDAWHCDNCRRCRIGKQWACEGCGGWSRFGAKHGNEEAKAMDAEHREQRKDDKSARKRARRPTGPNETTETWIHPPEGIEKCACKCTDFCTTRRCSCRKWGERCKVDCKCKSMTAPARHNKHTFGLTECDNPFNDRLTPFFGEEHPQVRAHVCFTKYLDQSAKKSRDCTPETMEQVLLRDKWPFDSPELMPELAEWRQKLSTLEQGSEERKEHMQKLFRHALGDRHSGEDEDEEEKMDVPFLMWYSFCQNAWVEDNGYHHCAVCGECNYFKHVWHCSVCRKCRDNIFMPCEGCGGVSSYLGDKRAGRV